MGKRYGYLALVLVSFLPSPTASSVGGRGAAAIRSNDFVGIGISVLGGSAAIMLTAETSQSVAIASAKAP